MSKITTREAAMRSRRPIGRWVLMMVCAAIAVSISTEDAFAGEFTVANCRSDSLNFSTRAYSGTATPGMKVRRACSSVGHGLRGLIVANVVRPGRVPRGAYAIVTINAPPGTTFSTFRWAGLPERSDCRFALDMWADGNGIERIPMRNVRPNQNCPSPGRAQTSGLKQYTWHIPGTTRIVQRAICVGDDQRKYCSTRGPNYLRTVLAEVDIADFVPPTVAVIPDTPIAGGAWVGGVQPLNYMSDDNVGVRSADALASGLSAGSAARPCTLAGPAPTFADLVPCPNGQGHLEVNTTAPGIEGTQALVVRAQDTAGNLADSPAVAARIDNTPPGRVDVSVEGGPEWRNSNDFSVVWSNPPEIDRAPIAAASYKLCPVGPGSCTAGSEAGTAISRIGVQVPAPGEWTLSLWRRDAAGNENAAVASVPIALRYDPEAPKLGFEAQSATDPTRVAVSVTDNVSGLAGGAIEMSPAGSGAWQALPTQVDGNRLLAQIDDVALPAGTYEVRARAFDHANNEASTDRRLDGQPMLVTLPLRVVSSVLAGFKDTRTVRKTIHRHGERRVVRRRVTVLRPEMRVRSGGHARVLGRLINRDGQGIGGAEIHVFSSSAVSPEQLVAVLQTDRDGRYQYTAPGSTSRSLRFAYLGSRLVLPAERSISMTVPAVSSLHVDRAHVFNGQTVTFTGHLRTQPVPAEGKLIELQVRLSRRWQTFRTARTTAAGRWAIRYRFKRTRGVQRFQFRARLPAEGNYPFAAGGSRPLTVRVKGL